METINYTKNQYLTPSVSQALRDAKTHILQGTSLFMNPVDQGFDLRWKEIENNPARHRILGARLRDYLKMDLPEIPDKTLFLDIETHNAEKMWDLPKEEFVRLVQWGWGWDGDIHVSTNLKDLLDEMNKADLIVAHNGHQFDFSVLLGDDALDMGMEHKLFDTFVHASLAVPAPYSYRNRDGVWMSDAAKPERATRWLSLDNLCYQFDVGGKEGDLKELAKKFNPPKTLVRNMDFSLIPTGDPEFLAYAHQDIVSLRDVTRMLLFAYPMNAYAAREQQFASINAQMSRNGFKVDVEEAQNRVNLLSNRKQELMGKMVSEYGLPSSGKQPWRTTAGKDAIFKILAEHNITPKTRPHWAKTATGNWSLGGEVLKEITEGTPAEELGYGLAELMGQRSLAELALSSTYEDGKVHPKVTTLQRSGRTSITNPGLTVWSNSAGGGRDKEYFIPDSEDEVLLEMDYSNADARAVAAYSGDTEFAKRFEVDEDGNDLYDGHNESGVALFGHEEYYAEIKENGVPVLREPSKFAGHAQNYHVGAKTLCAGLNRLCRRFGIDREFSVSEAYDLIDNFDNTFRKLKNWKMRMYHNAESGWLVNEWGRAMPIDDGRAFTQGPALMGQSATREILVDGLIRMYYSARWMILSLKATIHDAAVFSVPKEKSKEATELMRSNMEYTFHPEGGQEIHFSINVGVPAKNWREAGH